MAVTESFIAEVVIDHPDLALTPTLRRVSDISVRVESQPITGLESPTVFYVVSSADFEEFEDALDADPTVDEWGGTMEYTDSRLYQVTPSSSAKFTTPTIADLGVHVESIENAGRRWRFRLLAPDRDALGAYWQYCRDEGVQFRLEKLYRSGPQTAIATGRGVESALTDRQLEVARTVARMGYYDSDGASAAEVAAELDISQSTLSTHLRRIIGKLFDALFGPE
ncbi:helix-turn-helix domain-containing protein [Halosimplex salinum]|uniref:helix-turn-helix domain-containing protein n=1 Tax=Halosimplex salinum TaxID=1710538 RepID=UPI0019D01D05|nr:helix-turn-helix domain-containing protein [Halosimplex salinum]